MTVNGSLQLALYLVVLLALAKPLGGFMARVYMGQPSGLDRVLGPLERLIYRLCGVRAEAEMGWKTYAIAMLLFNLFGFLAAYALQRLQGVLPLNPGAHGFSEILYAFSSMGNNNGSAFAGLSANTPFYNLVGGLEMLASRYWIAIPALAIAGSLASKKLVPAGLGTLPTHTSLFVVMLIGVVIIVGALTFIPALALGPIVEHLLMIGA